MQFLRFIVSVLFSMFSLVGFGGGVHPDLVPQQVMEVAQQFIDDEYPALNKGGMKTVVESRGDDWIVTYELPAKFSGGRKVQISSPVILINKKTLRVVKVYEEQ